MIQYNHFTSKNLINFNHRFLEWSERQWCQQPRDFELSTGEICCNIKDSLYSDVFLDFCIRLSTTKLPTNYNDTLIYHNITLELIGYTALLPTQLSYSHKYSNLSASFDEFDKEFETKRVHQASMPMWYTPEWNCKFILPKSDDLLKYTYV